jgi:hypothetical protein
VADPSGLSTRRECVECGLRLHVLFLELPECVVLFLLDRVLGGQGVEGGVRMLLSLL